MDSLQPKYLLVTVAVSYQTPAEVERLLCQEQGFEEGDALEEELLSIRRNQVGLTQVQDMAWEVQLEQQQTMVACQLELEFVVEWEELAVLQ